MISAIHYKSNEAIDIECKDGAISRMSPSAADRRGLPIVAPGFVELQINGYHGLDFSDPQLSSDEILHLTKTLLKEGVTSFYPTVTTYPKDVIKKALSNISTAVNRNSLVKASISGIHLEGPFISKEDGARGAHKVENVIPPDWHLFQQWQESAEGLIQIITLSPEWPEAPEFIRKAVESGVRVAIGHSAATTDQIKAAADAGATMSTHLGNGAHAMLPRHPNYIWDQLAEDRLWSCIIADGVHLPDSFLKVVHLVKQDKTIIVSDAVYLSGMPPGEYTNRKGIKVVKTESGKLHLADNPNLLAGSAQVLTWGIEHLIQHLSIPFAEAWDMATINPATCMGLPFSGLNEGTPADFVLCNVENNHIHISETYKNGDKC